MIRLGEVELEVLHAPGHRPEQITLLVRDRSRGEQPWCILTADCLMVGDVARPDLAQDGREGAAALFRQAIPRLLALPDFVEVYPGHVAGSTCGRVTSGKVATTIGYERRYNPSLQFTDEEGFIGHMTRGQPPRPANVLHIVAINQGRKACTLQEPQVPVLDLSGARKLMQPGQLLLDTRSHEAFAAGHIPGSFNVQVSSGSFEQDVGWILPDDRPFLLVVDDGRQAQLAAHKLAFVGLDQRVSGALAIGVWREAGLASAELAQIGVQAVERMMRTDGLRVLDVRDADEWKSGHIASAVLMNFRHIPARMDELEALRDRHVAVICAAGGRSSIACSMLLHTGFRRVGNVTGGMRAWRQAGLPMVPEASESP